MTQKHKIYRLAYWIACIILAGTFFASGYQKVIDPPAFASAVHDYQLLPDRLVSISSLIFQWLEIVCGVCLLVVPRFRIAALWIVLFLLILFSGAIAINLIRGATIDCGCFSKASNTESMTWMTVVRNISLMALVGMAFYGKKKAAV